MFRKFSFVMFALALCFMILGSQKASQAQSSYVNAHVFTQPSDTENDYYWIRTIDDPFWGISGFMYIAGANNTYFVVPDNVNTLSTTEAYVSAPVTVGVAQQPGYLMAHVWKSNGVNYAGFVVVDLFDLVTVLDSSPDTQASGRGYIRIR